MTSTVSRRVKGHRDVSLSSLDSSTDVRREEIGRSGNSSDVARITHLDSLAETAHRDTGEVDLIFLSKVIFSTLSLEYLVLLTGD